MPIINNEQLFAEQAATLEGAHGQGRKAFQAAAHQALDFIVDYPGQVLATDERHSESELAVAYQAALTGLHGAIPKERLRRDFAQAINQRLIKAAATKQDTGARLNHAILVPLFEALHNSFPDEVGVSDDRFDILNKTQLRLEVADPEQFKTMVSDLITQAQTGIMPQIIEATNTPTNQLKISKDYRRAKLTYTQDGRVITVGSIGKRHFVEKVTKVGKGKQKVVRKLRVQQADFRNNVGYMSYQDLEGYLRTSEGDSKPKYKALEKSQTIKVADTILGQMREELMRRSDLHGSVGTAEDQTVDDMLQ